MSGTVVGQLKIVDNDLIGVGYLDNIAQIDMAIPTTIKTAPWPVSWWNQFVRYVNEKL